MTNVKSLDDVHSSVPTQHHRGGVRKMLSFMGPAYLISVGYMDPGNWATDIAGGSQFGYSLLWVLVMSNLIAILLQGMCARLGLVRGMDLAQASRIQYSTPINMVLYVLAELAIAATDLAEVLGMAIGLQLLFGIPLLAGVGITVVDTLVLMLLMRGNIRLLERIVLGFVTVIGSAFLVQVVLAQPQFAEVVKGLVPIIQNKDALYIAIGIIGATVMPHNLYLHSALVQTRRYDQSPKGIREALKYNLIDSTIALNVALLVNAGILVVAAAAFYGNGMHGVTEIQDAHKLLAPVLGSAVAPFLFAIALIASGQSSTVTGTLAGQVVMEGYLGLRMPPWLRRLVTRGLAIIPAVIVISVAGEQSVGKLLVFSQVLLSLQLGFAVLPLLHFVSDKKTMGEFAIPLWMKIGGWLAALVIVCLNMWLVGTQLQAWIPTLYPAITIGVALLVAGLFGVLCYVGITPFVHSEPKGSLALPHTFSTTPTAPQAAATSQSIHHVVAVAVDFSDKDQAALEAAIGLMKSASTMIILHVVESAGALVFGGEVSDRESKADREALQTYVATITARGLQADFRIGFGSPRRVLPTLTSEVNANVLVMAAHGHRGLTDVIRGATIDSVRHRVSASVFIVNT
jgi:manganese transport protein